MGCLRSKKWFLTIDGYNMSVNNFKLKEITRYEENKILF